MNILFVANLVPFPLDGGGKIKTFTTLQALSKKNIVDLVCFYEKENKSEAIRVLRQYCNKIIMIPIRVTTSENKIYIVKKALECLFTPKSLSIHKYFNKEMCRAIAHLMESVKYDVAYFNILQVYSYTKFIKRIQPDIKTVLDTQNCEALIFKRNASECNNIIKKLYLNLESSKLGRFEIDAIQDADELILLSQEDKEQLEKMAKHELKANIIPIGVRDPGYKKEIKLTVDMIRILFLGTLTWAPNNEGMIWFMEKVMPNLIKTSPKFELYIVGKNPSDRLKTLSEKYNNVTVTGYVDSVEEYYEKCDCMIVPLFFGSGQRVKIIEGFSHGMPIISTQIGAEGLEYRNNENIIIANDVSSFVDSIIRMNDIKLREHISKECRAVYLKYYSPEAIEQQLVKVIERLNKGNNL